MTTMSKGMAAPTENVAADPRIPVSNSIIERIMLSTSPPETSSTAC